MLAAVDAELGGDLVTARPYLELVLHLHRSLFRLVELPSLAALVVRQEVTPQGRQPVLHLVLSRPLSQPIILVKSSVSSQPTLPAAD